MNRFISLGEVRLGLRLIVKQPILSITIILALATGICLATMGFTFAKSRSTAAAVSRRRAHCARVRVQPGRRPRRASTLERYPGAPRSRRVSSSMSALVGGRPFSLMHGPSEVESITSGTDHARPCRGSRRRRRRPHVDSRRW